MGENHPSTRKVFLSTPSARRATAQYEHARIIIKISIHALREEGDDFEERKAFVHELFLSTPSARRATNKNW